MGFNTIEIGLVLLFINIYHYLKPTKIALQGMIWFHMSDFMWWSANAPVDSNCSRHMSQIFCFVRDCVADGEVQEQEKGQSCFALME